MPRYNKKRILSNSSEYYKTLRKKRKIRVVRHYETPIMYNPGIADRGSLVTTEHIWKFGDRFYNLANKYYGDSRYWWVIAWWNGAPTEAHMDNGDVIHIPVNIENALNILGAS